MTDYPSDETYAYLTTTGRVTGHTHRIEIWFVVANSTAYIMNDAGRSNWAKNVARNPRATLEIRKATFQAIARAPRDADEDALARRLLLEKYSPTERDLEAFTSAPTTVVVAFELFPGE